MQKSQNIPTFTQTYLQSTILQPAAREIAILAFYAILSLGVSWPLAAWFTTGIPPTEDPRHNLWVLWHIREWLAGNHPLFELPMLYYPLGASLLTHGLGPVTGFFALPFWPWGPAAAHNGAVLVGLTLTGYCMYRLGREVALARSAAIFAGVVLLTSPMVLAGIGGHMTKVFLGGVPLLLLFLLRTLNPQRSIWWAWGVGASFLLLLLHSGYQFIFGAMLAGIWIALHLIRPTQGERRTALIRVGAISLASLIVAGPLLFMIQQAAAQNIQVKAEDIMRSRPTDLLYYIFPLNIHRSSQLFAELRQVIQQPAPEGHVWLPWVALLLAGCAVWLRLGDAWRWLVLFGIMLGLSLGPTLALAGHRFDVITPLHFLPRFALDFMRIPPRFMLPGFVAFAMLVGLGIHALIQRWPRWHIPTISLALIVHLLLIWPNPFRHGYFYPVPEFYQQLAHDHDDYGVFDVPYTRLLPHGRPEYVSFSSYAQFFQMFHRKGIASGYLSRTYPNHPLFQWIYCQGTKPDFSDPCSCGGTVEEDLIRHNYRYVVIHKNLHLDEFADKQRQAFLQLFADRQPVHEDEDTVVYAVGVVDLTPSELVVCFSPTWYPWHTDRISQWRWTSSPAQIVVRNPLPTTAMLEIDALFIHDPDGVDGIGPEGVLYVDDGHQVQEVTLRGGATTQVPVQLQYSSVITMTLAAGNYQPSQYGSTDASYYGFSVTDLRIIPLIP